MIVGGGAPYEGKICVGGSQEDRTPVVEPAEEAAAAEDAAAAEGEAATTEEAPTTEEEPAATEDAAADLA